MTDSLQEQPEDAGRVTSDVRAALAALPEAEMLRLRVIARLRARALPGDVAWSDLLHEAVVRALTGSRHWPVGVPVVAFLAGVMRSICDEYWRRHARQRVLAGTADDSAVADPERDYAARETLASIHRLFAADAVATKIITGLLGGMEAEELRVHYGISKMEYDTARKRIRRVMLRYGLVRARP